MNAIELWHYPIGCRYAPASLRSPEFLSGSTSRMRPICAAGHRCSTLCIYAMRYEWEEAKNLRNQRKHDGITFEIATLVFEDEHCLVYPDRIDSKTKEQRWHAI